MNKITKIRVKRYPKYKVILVWHGDTNKPNKYINPSISSILRIIDVLITLRLQGLYELRRYSENDYIYMRIK